MTITQYAFRLTPNHLAAFTDSQRDLLQDLLAADMRRSADRTNRRTAVNRHVVTDKAKQHGVAANVDLTERAERQRVILAVMSTAPMRTNEITNLCRCARTFRGMRQPESAVRHVLELLAEEGRVVRHRENPHSRKTHLTWSLPE